MTKNKLLCIADIRSWQPCYDPAKYLPEDWSGTIKGILRHRDIPVQDKLWVVLRMLDDSILHTFIDDCLSRTLNNTVYRGVLSYAAILTADTAGWHAWSEADSREGATAAYKQERQRQINLLLTLIG